MTPSNNPPKAPRVSPAMARVLVNLYCRRPPWCHLYGRSMFGAADQTERALLARELVTGLGDGLALTELGRLVAAELEEEIAK